MIGYLFRRSQPLTLYVSYVSRRHIYVINASLLQQFHAVPCQHLSPVCVICVSTMCHSLSALSPGPYRPTIGRQSRRRTTSVPWRKITVCIRARISRQQKSAVRRATILHDRNYIFCGFVQCFPNLQADTVLSNLWRCQRICSRIIYRKIRVYAFQSKYT